MRPARGLLGDLRSEITELREGELVYAEDQSSLYVLRHLPSGARILELVVGNGFAAPSAPAFQYLGLVDVRQALSVPAGVKSGNIVVASQDGAADGGWTGIGGLDVKSGDALVFDGTSWFNLGQASSGNAPAAVGLLRTLGDVTLGQNTPVGHVLGTRTPGVWGVLDGIDLGRMPGGGSGLGFLKIKSLVGAGVAPTALQVEAGELAINLDDHKLFSKDDAGAVFELIGYYVSPAPPDVASRTTGMIWVDTSAAPTLKTWDGTGWGTAQVDKKYFYTDHTAP